MLINKNPDERFLDFLLALIRVKLYYIFFDLDINGNILNTIKQYIIEAGRHTSHHEYSSPLGRDNRGVR